MNKTTIEWCDLTWNPVTGCKHGCPYCYARKIAERFRGSKAWPKGFEPMFHPERMKDLRKAGTKWTCPQSLAKGSTIFVCSMADLFGSWVPNGWINETLTFMRATPRHTYILLTKNPVKAKHQLIENFYQFGEKFFPSKIPQNWWIGASVESSTFTGRIDELRNIPTDNRFVSFEPLLGDADSVDFPLDLTGIKQVIIGAQTNPDHYVGLEWVMKICEAADRAGAKVFMKDSLAGRWPDRELRRELAWELHK